MDIHRLTVDRALVREYFHPINQLHDAIRMCPSLIVLPSGIAGVLLIMFLYPTLVVILSVIGLGIFVVVSAAVLIKIVCCHRQESSKAHMQSDLAHHNSARTQSPQIRI